LVLAVGGFRARERKMRRLRALRGDQDALPLARMASDIARRWFISVLNARAESLSGPSVEESARRPDKREMVLTLQWRQPTLWQDAGDFPYPRWRAIGLLALPFVICGSCSFAAGLVAVYSATQIDLPKFIWVEVPSLWIWPYVIFASWRPNPRSVLLIPFRRSPFGITADEEGIEERTPFGERHVVRWEDARLLEVRSIKEENSEIGYQYILYSQRDAVKWSIDFRFPRTDIVPDGMRRDEMESRGRQVLYLIAARCGLLPRTFDRKLQAAT
jgi:hypothetical protein